MKILESIFIYTFIAIGVVIYQLMKAFHEVFGTIGRIDALETPHKTLVNTEPRPAF